MAPFLFKERSQPSKDVAPPEISRVLSITLNADPEASDMTIFARSSENVPVFTQNDSDISPLLTLLTTSFALIRLLLSLDPI